MIPGSGGPSRGAVMGARVHVDDAGPVAAPSSGVGADMESNVGTVADIATLPSEPVIR